MILKNTSYLIDKATLYYLRVLCARDEEQNGHRIISIGWGDFVYPPGELQPGVTYRFCDPHKQKIPSIYLFEDVLVSLAFPSDMPEAFKSGVICYRADAFAIRRPEAFKPESLVEGTFVGP